MALPSLELTVEVQCSSGRTYRWLPDAKDAAQRPQIGDFQTQAGDGFATGSVALSRRIDRDYPDVALKNTVRFISQDGRVIYEGRVAAVGRSTSDGHKMVLELKGWMTYLRQRPFTEIYADRSAERWQPPSLNLRKAIAAAGYVLDQDFTAEAGQMLSFEGNTDKSVPANSRAVLEYTAPDGTKAREFQYTLTEANMSNISTNRLFAGDDDTVVTGSWDETFTLGATSSVASQRFAEGRKHVALTINRGSPGTPASPAKRHYPDFCIYGDHDVDLQANGDEPDGVYISDVFRDIVSRFAPKFSTDGVLDTTYPASHVAFPTPTDPYDSLADLNASYHHWLLSCWEGPDLSFRPPDYSKADWVVDYNGPGVVVDLQGDTDDDLANGIFVSYNDIKHGPRVLTPIDYPELLDTNEENPANLFGEDDWIKLEVPYDTVESDALRLGVLALAENNAPRSPGTITVAGGYVKDAAGNKHPGFDVRCDETIAIRNFPNDRPRLITSTTWTGGHSLTINVENDRRQLDTYFARVEARLSANGL